MMTTSLQQFGTIAFDLAFMQRMIRLTDESKPSLTTDIWISTVPKAYREEIEIGIRVVGAKLVGLPLTPLRLTQFVVSLSDWVWVNVQPQRVRLEEEQPQPSKAGRP